MTLGATQTRQLKALGPVDTRNHKSGRSGGMKMKSEEKQYRVFNRTDGVFAAPSLMTLSEAEEFIRRFPARFRRQGYYFTASRERIPASYVELEIVDENLDPVLAGGQDGAPGHADPPT